MLATEHGKPKANFCNTSSARMQIWHCCETAPSKHQVSTKTESRATHQTLQPPIFERQRAPRPRHSSDTTFQKIKRTMTMTKNKIIEIALVFKANSGPGKPAPDLNLGRLNFQRSRCQFEHMISCTNRPPPIWALKSSTVAQGKWGGKSTSAILARTCDKNCSPQQPPPRPKCIKNIDQDIANYCPCEGNTKIIAFDNEQDEVNQAEDKPGNCPRTRLTYI